MKFDLVITNPPFQDTSNRGKTPHKLWIDFTKMSFSKLLFAGGFLHQVSPASFQSPSNKVLDIFKKYLVCYVDFRTSSFFPEVGSSFSHYLIQNKLDSHEETNFFTTKGELRFVLNDECFYLPNDLSPEALSIHKKVIFQSKEKLPVQFDYVTCHNIIIHKNTTLSKNKTDTHIHPIFHTNKQIWYSSIRQEFASKKKVMWTRSGYCKPFFDNGILGGTDMVYFVECKSKKEGLALEKQMNSILMNYIYVTAKWSGFGNEKVFLALPLIPQEFTEDAEIFSFFKLTAREVDYVKKFMGRGRKED